MKQTFTKKIAKFFFLTYCILLIFWFIQAQLGTSNYKDQYTSTYIPVSSQD